MSYNFSVYLLYSRIRQPIGRTDDYLHYLYDVEINRENSGFKGQQLLYMVTSMWIKTASIWYAFQPSPYPKGEIFGQFIGSLHLFGFTSVIRGTFKGSELPHISACLHGYTPCIQVLKGYYDG